ncbi:MAG: bifunctional pyr operon transcriptional regulator/uracil phosphoribosyltransferase PyrR [Planctomycetaceae bacterium]|nr:bifunctional pyr operon transcriptional regulator/uracil phosphoribosyltransferase PyrR [Planctomycetaceae bacterium]
MEILLDEKQLGQAVARLAELIQSDIPSKTQIAVIGIRSRGEILAQRLIKALQGHFTYPVLNGTLDITLYRDDLNRAKGAPPRVRTTEINFDITDKLILLVDDVLYTGRSVRAAMNALTDFGRPRMMRLAVLVDRGRHEYPICADYIALQADIDPARSVRVRFKETDNEDRVIVE